MSRHPHVEVRLHMHWTRLCCVSDMAISCNVEREAEHECLRHTCVCSGRGKDAGKPRPDGAACAQQLSLHCCPMLQQALAHRLPRLHLCQSSALSRLCMLAQAAGARVVWQAHKASSQHHRLQGLQASRQQAALHTSLMAPSQR